MSQIWKFTLQPVCEIEMPLGSKILSVVAQDNNTCIWAKVDPRVEKIKRRFVGFGTGHEIPDDVEMSFVGTAFLNNDGLVFHIFEVISENKAN